MRRRSLTRRAFLGAVVGTTAVVVPLSASAGAAATVHWLYWLDPDWGAGDPGCVPNRGQSACGGCYACVRHYQNKLFASAAAADAGRAHPACKCTVAAAFTVDPDTYTALFPDGTVSVDRRTPGVNELLAGSSSAPAPTSPDPSGQDLSGSNTGSVLALTGSPIGTLAVAGAGVLAAGVVAQRVATRTAPANAEGTEGWITPER